MNSKDQKKEAIRQFKERKPAIGVFAVRCLPTGQVWVGTTRDLRAAKNGTWFTLRTGVHRVPTLQQEWNTHGEPFFTYEELEKFDEDVAALLIPDRLKDRKKHWLGELAAEALL